ncbi:hypothetical protein BT96DRAFT_704183 [Gymnopus androsaceus JB14]|uniref:Uncharacterized protein n=1 Tax=Gymnopus androsaceus JB14 TaxID=1447944 RepID=A0A6A4HMK8_9AGAR|nr:hypothetical protein BT96DRAFT_704183 [Gymnopus androsaceus JB14]
MFSPTPQTLMQHNQLGGMQRGGHSPQPHLSRYQCGLCPSSKSSLCCLDLGSYNNNRTVDATADVPCRRSLGSRRTIYTLLLLVKASSGNLSGDLRDMGYKNAFVILL